MNFTNQGILCFYNSIILHSGYLHVLAVLMCNQIENINIKLKEMKQRNKNKMKFKTKHLQ